MAITLDDDYPVGARGNACSICRASKRANEDHVVNSGVDINFEGMWFQCEHCTREAGRLLGMVDKGHAKQAIEENAVLRAQVELAEKERADALELVDKIRAFDAVYKPTPPQPVSDAGAGLAAGAAQAKQPTKPAAANKRTRTRKAAAKK